MSIEDEMAAIETQRWSPEITPTLQLCKLVDEINELRTARTALETENILLKAYLADMLVLAADLGHNNKSEPARNAKRILGW